MNLFNNFYNNKKVLITGDSGFKGSWLAIWLNELDAEVFGYSLPAKTDKDNYVTSNLSSIITHVDGDIRDYRKLSDFVNEINPDLVFHLAAQPLVLDSYENPKYTFETNIIGTINLFEAVRQNKHVKVIINITSDKCYQNNEWVWGYREQDPMGGKDPYSASKGCSELVTSSYQYSFFNNECPTKLASARAGNVIGGGDWAEFRIVPDFFRAVDINKPLYLRYPHATRPWQLVLEPLGGYLLLAKKLYEESKFVGGWNFGPSDNSNYSVLELIEKIKEFAQKGNIQFEEGSKKHEASLLKLDISKAQNQLNWHPVLSFEETVRFTVDGYTKGCAYSDRIKQISDYIKIGKAKNIKWINNN